MPTRLILTRPSLRCGTQASGTQASGKEAARSTIGKEACGKAKHKSQQLCPAGGLPAATE